MGQTVGLLTVPWLPVLIWTVKIWIVITNPNPNTNPKPNTNPYKNPSPNPVLTVQILTAQISPQNFTVQILTVQIPFPAITFLHLICFFFYDGD